ncbi:MAG TPA: 4Fe-4S dicluster domain-containing protein [Anaeromyxobacter sp.]|nr:4Fe-4S dicluster domain-containing protein [Anaeromyxobacter sp.]
MNAFEFLLENLRRGSVTLRFPARAPEPLGYRGLVEMDRDRCQGCGMCAFVCTSSSIRFEARTATYDWSYDAARCTFCGRCVDGCASQAISMQHSRPPVYTREGALRVALTLPRKPPPGAAPPAGPAPAAGQGGDTGGTR